MVLAAATVVEAVETLDVGRGWRKHATPVRILEDILFLVPCCCSEGCLPGSEAISHHVLQPWCSAQEMIHFGLNPLEQEWSRDVLPEAVCFCQVGWAR